jgi:(p)ppGpp synthase/HD superfamily hydrolase
MNIVERALAFARKAHQGQVQKYTGEPYITHPIAVMEIVRTVPMHTDYMLAAALLHDVIENTEYTRSQIEAAFGSVVGDMVFWLTDVSRPRHGRRHERKAIDRQHLARACGASQTIKCADLIHNSESIKKHDPNFWKVYQEEKRLLLAVLTKADRDLWNRAMEMVK